MKKYSWYCIVFCVLSMTAAAQELPFALHDVVQPIRVVSGTSPLYFISETAVDATGNTYMIGYFSGQIDFEPGPADSLVTSELNNITDVFLAKYNAAGHLVYVKAIKGPAHKRANTIAFTSGGKVLIGGYFGGTANFDPGVSDYSLISNGGTDGYYARFDAATGNFEFAAALGGLGNDGVMKFLTAPNNDGYVYGYFAQTVDFDFGPGIVDRTAVAAQDRFLAKYDATLVLQWVHGVPDLAITTIGLDANGFYAAGNFAVGADADPGVGSVYISPAGSSDIWLSKFDLNGNLVWNNVIGGVDFENVLDLALDASSNIYLSGNFSQATDFNPVGGVTTYATSNGMADAYVAKYSNNGSFQWVRTFGGIRGDNAQSLTMMQNNTIGVAVNFSSASIDADPEAGTRTLTNAGPDNFSDAAIILLTENGSLLDAHRYGVASINETAGAINSDGAGTFSVVGNFTNPVDFDPSAGVVILPNLTGFQQAYVSTYTLLAGLPVAQPTALSFTNQTGTSIDVSFTGSAADGYVVLRRASQAPTSVPKDAALLSTGDFLNDAVVAYSGPATSFSDQGLSANITYHYAVYAYNNSNGSVNYLQAAPLIGNSVTNSITYSLATDSVALLDLYFATNGPGWANSNWLSGDIDTWNGVTVTGNRVTKLVLGSNALVGSLPSTIGNLTALDTLELWANQITGSIPSEIGNLTALRYLDLSPNQFTGNIPPELGNLTLLTTLWINNNLLTGTIPSELGNLSGLQNLYMQGNQLSGSIPASFGNLSALGLLDMSGNTLSGNIPVELGSLSSLATLNLTSNQLSGSIPAQLGSLSTLLILQLDQNLLDGNIPAELGNLTSLQTLKLNSNKLTGSIPAELGSLSNLVYTDLGGNQLTGSVPSSLFSIATLQTLGLARNQLSGTFPSEITNASSLVNLWIDTNQFTGTFPAMTSVTNPAIDGVTMNLNQFDGLPDLSSLNGLLSYIDVSNNNLTFEDLEANAGIGNINYAPQKDIPASGDLILNRGDLLTLAYSVGGSSNQYQWWLDSNSISLANADNYSVGSVSSTDGGLYSLNVTNALVPGLTISSAPVKVTVVSNYYWIGDGGDMKDINHWSLTSGAVDPPPALPGQNDNVFFDANSFTTPGQVVTILDDGSTFGVAFKTMDWRGVTNTPTFQIVATTSDWVGNECYGSLYFDDNMNLDFYAAEFYMSSDADYEFDTRGHNLGENSWLQFNAQHPVTGNVLSDLNNVWIYAAQGTLNLNGHTLIGRETDYPSIWLAGTLANPVTADFTNSVIDIGTLQISPYSTLIDDDAQITVRTKLNAGDQNFNHMKFGSLTILPIAATNVYDTLEILQGATVKFLVGTTHVNSAFIANGDLTEESTQISSSTEGIPAILNKPNGTVTVSYIHIEDITATGGATFNAFNSWDDGGNMGWNFTNNNPPSDSDLELISSAQIRSIDSNSFSTIETWSIDNSDNILLVGFFEGTVDFDTGAGETLLSAPDSDYYDGYEFVAKYTNAGALAWVYSFASDSLSLNSASLESVTSDGAGNVYVGGGIRGTYDVDPGAGVTSFTSSATYGDAYFAKYDAAGNFLWAKQLITDTSGESDIEVISIDDAGNIIVSGSFGNGTIDVDPGAGTVELTNGGAGNIIFLAKYDSDGNYLWAIDIGDADSYPYPNAIVTDNANNIYISYDSYESIDNNFVAKYSPAGVEVWVAQNSNCYGEELGFTINETNNKLYVTGGYNDTPTFTGATGSGTLPATVSEDENGFIVEYDLNGAFQRALGFVSTESVVLSVLPTEDGNLIITGGHEGMIDLDPGAGAFEHFNSQAAWIAKLSSSGNFIWGATIPNSYGVVAHIDNQNQLSGVILFENTIDVDLSAGVTNLTSLGEDIAFLWFDIQGGITSADSLALQQFYTATGGPNWTTRTNWLSGNISTWFGVTVVNDQITQINLPNNNLTDTVPAGALSLNDLTALNLSGNNITAVPDFSTLPEVTSVNISNNRLDFASLESNVDVPGIVLNNQKEIPIAPDSILVTTGDDHLLETTIGGTANSYLWKRNTISVGVTTDDILIENISRSNMGSYVLEITNSLVPGVTLHTKPVKVLATATLSGKLMMSPTTAAVAGDVRLLRVTSANGYDTLKMLSVGTDGAYAFTNVVLDDYQIVGLADTLTTGQERALPTYYQSTIYWEEADTLFVEGSLTDLDIISQLEPAEAPTGTGVIAGIVEEDDGTGSRGQATSRVGGAGVSARRTQGTGKGKEILELVAYVYTNDNGEFSIGGLPEGDYRINIQYPGYPMDEESDIDISIGGSPLDEVVTVEATVAEGKISVKKLIVTGIEGSEYVADVHPNPASENIHVSFENQSSVRTIELLDTKGTKIENKQAQGLSTEVDVRNLQPGLYLLKVKEKGNAVKTVRVSVQE